MKKLGFGLMRLPLLNKDDSGSIDIEQVKKMVDIFIENGFTYFDTAWMYCNFKSEEAAKIALVDRYDRNSYTLATKLHASYVNSLGDRDRIFNEQLKKTGVSYFDYYLLHALGEENYKKYVNFHCFEWLVEKKKQGLVKKIGFSFHDSAEVLDKILTEQDYVDFVQLQINYLDFDSEGVQSRKCYEVATKHGIPVIVMEPVKGGTLANVPESVYNLFKEQHADMSIASWAVRFAASLENVFMVLSGMSNIEQLNDNISYMKDFEPLTESELKTVATAVKLINDKIEIPCTGCEYCVSGCPKNIPIPKYFSLYNADRQELEEKIYKPQWAYYDNLAEKFGKASDCIGCGKCAKVCPQHLKIPSLLKKVAEYFED